MTHWSSRRFLKIASKMNAVLACRGNLTAPRTFLGFGAAPPAVSLPESGKPSFAEGSNWPSRTGQRAELLTLTRRDPKTCVADRLPHASAETATLPASRFARAHHRSKACSAAALARGSTSASAPASTTLPVTAQTTATALTK